jgi:hypothetical protein
VMQEVAQPSTSGSLPVSCHEALQQGDCECGSA